MQDERILFDMSDMHMIILHQCASMYRIYNCGIIATATGRIINWDKTARGWVADCGLLFSLGSVYLHECFDVATTNHKLVLFLASVEISMQKSVVSHALISYGSGKLFYFYFPWYGTILFCARPNFIKNKAMKEEINVSHLNNLIGNTEMSKQSHVYFT